MELLRRISDDEMPDFAGQSVVVIGGGNVAMDVTRSAIGHQHRRGGHLRPTGGVMDAALRSAYYLVTNKNPHPNAFEQVRGSKPWKEAAFSIPGAGDVKVAMVSGLANIRQFMEAVDSGEVGYNFVEVGRQGADLILPRDPGCTNSLP